MPCSKHVCRNQQPHSAQQHCKQATTNPPASKAETCHSLLEPEGAAHLLPVLPHDDMLQALKQGRGDGVVPQPVELLPGGGVGCPQTQPIHKLHLVEGICQQLLALHAAVQVHDQDGFTVNMEALG